jgi:two-component system chemotaxis response regulator CheY
MGIKLVIVDDAPFIREAIRGILKGSEVELVAEASDGEEAVLIVQKLQPDVVLMDLVLPKKNGIDAAREILENNPKVKIVACSTEGQEGMLIRALDVGCVNFLAKPFKAEELLKTIRAAGGQKK